LLDFSTGSTPLSFRIICYCRHHNEKTGFWYDSFSLLSAVTGNDSSLFSVVLTLKDNFGRTVGEVTTTPILITDDHKSVPKLTPVHTADEDDGDSYGTSTKRRAKRMLEKHSENETRMKMEDADEGEGVGVGVGAIRNRHRSGRKANAVSRSSSGISKLASTPTARNIGAPSITTAVSIYSHVEPPSSEHQSSHSYATHSESPLATTAPSSPSAGLSPPLMGGGVGESSNPYGDMDGVVNSFASMPLMSPTSANFYPPDDGSLSMHGLVNNHMPTMSAPTPALLPPPPSPYPYISKVTPASGPMLGGIEVILLGGNFSQEVLANAYIAFGNNCVEFAGSGAGMVTIDGGIVNTGARVFSETAVICTVPPSAVPGLVEVKLLGLPIPANLMDMEHGQAQPPPMFEYRDEVQRDL